MIIIVSQGRECAGQGRALCPPGEQTVAPCCQALPVRHVTPVAGASLDHCWPAAPSPVLLLSGRTAATPARVAGRLETAVCGHRVVGALHGCVMQACQSPPDIKVSLDVVTATECNGHIVCIPITLLYSNSWLSYYLIYIVLSTIGTACS